MVSDKIMLKSLLFVHSELLVYLGLLSRCQGCREVLSLVDKMIVLINFILGGGGSRVPAVLETSVVLV